MITGELVHAILESVGVTPERFTIDWASAAEAPRFVSLITSFTKKIKDLGPVGHAEGKDRNDLLIKLSAAKMATGVMKLRAGLGNLAKDFRNKGDYSLETIRQKIGEKLGAIVRSEVGGQEIELRLERQGPISVDELAGRVGLSTDETAAYLAKLGKKGQVSEKNGHWVLA